MATTTPVEAMSLAQYHLRKTLADSATWRTWVGAINQEQALNRVHLVGISPPDLSTYTRSELEGKRPFAIVSMAPQEGFEMDLVAVGADYEYAESGLLHMLIVDDVPQEITDNYAEIDVRFINTLGRIFKEMGQMAGKAGYLAIRNAAVESGPERSHEDAESGQGNTIAVNCRFTWSDGG